MKKQYYLKDKKALIHVAVKKPGALGKTYYVPRTLSYIWCYAKQLSQETVFKAKLYGEDESRFFVFNRGTTVELYDLILYRGKWYKVTRVDTMDDYNTDIFVHVQDAPKGSTPTAETLKPYGWEPEQD